MADLDVAVGGDYSCEVIGLCGAVRSGWAHVAFDSLPTDRAQPLLVTRKDGGLFFREKTAYYDTLQGFAVFADRDKNGVFSTRLASADSTRWPAYAPMPAGSPVFFRTAVENACGDGPR